MHTDNTEPEVSVGLHGTIKESPESESEPKYSRSYELTHARINALTVVFLDV